MTYICSVHNFTPIFQLGLFLFVGPLALFCLVALFCSDYYLIATCYLCWYLWDIPSSTNGGRSGPWVDWMRSVFSAFWLSRYPFCSEYYFCIWTRSWRLWKLNAAYYPVTLVKTADLDPKKNHLVCCHPHGILCFGAVVRIFYFNSFGC